MGKIKNIVFDLGGVILDLDRDRAVRRFEQIGLSDAEELIDPYHQKGIFLDLEEGRIDRNEFYRLLREHMRKDVPEKDIDYAWMGFVVALPEYKLDYILKLRENYKVYLLSNTNPIIMGWARTGEFSSTGNPITHYFDKIYTSYEMGVCKPAARIFNLMMKDADMNPEETLFVDDGKSNTDMASGMGFVTYTPANGEDWREALNEILNKR